MSSALGFYKKWHLKCTRIIVNDNMYISQKDVNTLYEKLEQENQELKSKLNRACKLLRKASEHVVFDIEVDQQVDGFIQEMGEE